MVHRVGKKHKGRSRDKGFTYTPRSAADVKARAEQKGGRFDSITKSGADTFRCKEGDNLIRFLPPTWKSKNNHYGHDVWVHNNVGADNSTYLCLQKMKNEDCPICDAYRSAQEAGEEEDAKALKPSQKVVSWIIDRDADQPIPKLFVTGWSLDRDINSLCHNRRTGKVLLIEHPDDGYDLTIKRTGTGLMTKYHGIAIERDSSPIHEDEKIQEQIMHYIEQNPVPSMLNYFDAEYLEKVLAGAKSKSEDEDEDDEDEDEDERPSKKKKKPSKRRDDDDDDGDEDEDEDERPKKKKKPSKDDDEEDEEDDDEDEDDEDERPSKKKKRRR